MHLRTFGKYKVPRKYPGGSRKKEIQLRDKVEMKHSVDLSLSKAVLNELFLQTFVHVLLCLSENARQKRSSIRFST